MKPTYFFAPFLLLFFLSFNALSQNHTAPTDPKLESEIRKIIQDFKGDVGIYVLHLPSGKEVQINADSIFPTASVVKIPILVGLFEKIDQNELGYRQELVYRDSIKYGGSGLMQFYKDSVKTNLNTLAALMITYSDNTTSLWCQALAGGGVAINPIMDRYGFVNTKVNSRTPGREKIREKYGWGQTTPKEMGQLMAKIRKGEIVSPHASDRMYRLMTNIFYDDGAISQIPASVQSASKQGMVNASRNEVIVVNAPSGDYVLSIFTNNNQDQRWKYDNEGDVLIRKISNLLWNYFEPEHPFEPEHRY